jgi:hypothetical protein
MQNFDVQFCIALRNVYVNMIRDSDTGIFYYTNDHNIIESGISVIIEKPSVIMRE